MKKAVFVKSIVVLFLSTVVGLYIYFDEVRKGALGKDEFLKRESIRFDHFLEHPHLSIIIAGLLLCAMVFGLYELICYAILKMAAKKKTA